MVLKEREMTAMTSVASVASERVRSTTSYAWKQFFPFLKLFDSKDGSVRASSSTKVRRARRFLYLSVVIWICTAFCICYLVLSLASHSFVSPQVIDVVELKVKWVMEPKRPIMGHHYSYFVIGKHLLEIAILHYICGYLMEPMVDIYSQRFVLTDPEVMGQPGVIKFWINLWSRLCGTNVESFWLQPFIADTLLLLFVGVAGLLYDLDMCFRKNKIHDKRMECGDDGFCANHTVVVFRTCTQFYIGILMIGFLASTLTYNIAPVASRRNEFNMMMTLSLILWMLEFLILTFERELYTSMFSHAKSHERLVAAGAQLFCTHGAAMLGAIRLGHTCHFRKCPDLTWSKFFTRMLPALVLISFISFFNVWRRYLHDWRSAYYNVWVMFILPLPYLHVFWSIAGGSLLIFLARRNSMHNDHGHDDLEEVVELGHVLDYDLMLIAITFSFAVFFNIVCVFREYAEHNYWSFVGVFLHLFAPAGIVVFTWSVWHHPPKKGTLAYHGVWFAFIFCASQFIYFQTQEDCHISSDLPACCGYPTVFLTEAETALCDKGQRCLKKGPIEFNFQGAMQHQELYCAYGHGSGEESGHSGDEHDDSHRRLSDDHSDAAFGYGDCCCCVPKYQKWCHGTEGHPHQCPVFSKEVDPSAINASCRHELECRWKYFNKIGGASTEDAAHKSEETVSYQLFETIGMAATVEMYFTILGIILKVIFITQHPNSDKILELDTHHHHADDKTGETFVVQNNAARRTQIIQRASTANLTSFGESFIASRGESIIASRTSLLPTALSRSSSRQSESFGGNMEMGSVQRESFGGHREMGNVQRISTFELQVGEIAQGS